MTSSGMDHGWVWSVGGYLNQEWHNLNILCFLLCNFPLGFFFWGSVGNYPCICTSRVSWYQDPTFIFSFYGEWDILLYINAEKFKADLMKIAMTTLSSKILSQDKEHFAKLAVDAVMRLKVSRWHIYLSLVWTVYKNASSIAGLLWRGSLFEPSNGKVPIAPIHTNQDQILLLEPPRWFGLVEDYDLAGPS